MERFQRWTPFEVFEKADAEPGKRLGFRGVISTEHEDLEGDVVLQDGIDFRPLLARGVLNDTHGKKLGTEIGAPTRLFRLSVPDPKTGRSVKATGVEGFLTDDDDGRRIFEKARALQKLGRSYGFSLEGGILHRDPVNPKVVDRAVCRQLAVTRVPVNPYTSLQTLEKSLDAVRERLLKATTVGHALPAAGRAVAGELAPLVREDLEGGPRVATWGGFDWPTYVRTWDAEAARIAALPAHLTKSHAAGPLRPTHESHADLVAHQLRAVVAKPGGRA